MILTLFSTMFFQRTSANAALTQMSSQINPSSDFFPQNLILRAKVPDYPHICVNALQANCVNISRGNNREFVSTVNWKDNPSFAEFLNSDKEVPTLVKQVLNSYGIPTLDTLGGDAIFNFPDAMVLGKKLEHDITLYLSVKNYVRRNLHQIEEYMSRNAVLIIAYVGAMKRDLEELMAMYQELYGPNKKTMSMPWQLGFQEYLNLAHIAEEDILRFEKARDWRERMKNIIKRTY